MKIRIVQMLLVGAFVLSLASAVPFVAEAPSVAEHRVKSRGTENNEEITLLAGVTNDIYCKQASIDDNTIPMVTSAKEVSNEEVSECDEVEFIDGWTTTSVNVRPIPNTESDVLEVYKFNTKVEYTPISDEWVKIKYNDEYAYISIDYISNVEIPYNEMSTPYNDSFKSYMDASCITNVSSDQYALKSNYVLGNYGIWTVDGRYCIAVGSYYTTTIGTYIDVVLEDGSIIPCIVADCKADIHTDSTNRQNPNGSVIEFVVNTSSLPSEVRGGSGSLGSLDEFGGEIDVLRVYN